MPVTREFVKDRISIMDPQIDQACPECGAPLESDGVCLACAFGAALAADDAEVGAVADEGFTSFAPREAGAFGSYTLLRRLGAGGMGVIWEAEETRLKRRVALKMIRGFAFSTEAEKKRFHTEAQAVAHLDHPHIVPIFEVNEAEGQPYFTMKLLGGGSLAERLMQGALPARDAAMLMEKLARAVQHAHERGVLHRDLKPGNVLFDVTGEPFLTDFGLAKLADTEVGLTQTNAQLGTPQYMSPEQAGGCTRKVTTASDVWALGAMFFQMLTGRVPFPGVTTAEIFSRIAHEDPVSMRRPGIPPDRDLETLCHRCLEKEPVRRLRSAGFLAGELGRWLRGEPIRARRVTGPERALRWTRRHPWRVAAVAALAISLLAGTIVSLTMWRTSEAHRKQAVDHAEQARENARAERFTAYVATMGAALAARERHDFARARKLLDAAPEEHRGFEWRLLQHLCAGDQAALFRLPGGEIPEAMSPGPDGDSLAIVSHEGVLHVCSPDGQPLRAPRPLPAPAPEKEPGKLNPRDYHSLHYAPGGRHFACSFRNTVRVFDAGTLEVLMEKTGVIQPQSAWLDAQRLLFGDNIGVAVSRGQAACIFDVEHRTTIPLPGQWLGPLAVSGDRSLVVVTDAATYEVALFRAADLPGAEPLRTVSPLHRWHPQAAGRVSMLALSTDGAYLAAVHGTHDAPARTLEVAETATGHVLLGQRLRDALTDLAFHPGEPQVAVTNADGTVRLFHFLQPEPTGLSTYDDDCVMGIREPLNGNDAQSPPRRLLTRSAQDGRAVFLLGHEGRGLDVCYAPDGSRLFTAAADGTVRGWAPRVPQPAVRLPDVRVLQMQWHPAASPDGSRLLYSDWKGAAHYWREGRGSIPVSPNHMPLAVLPQGRLATMSRNSSDVLFWEEAGDGLRQTGRIKGPGFVEGFTELLCGRVSSDGRRIAGMTPGRIFVVDLETQTTSAPGDQGWQAGPSRAWNLAFSPDGRHLVATGLGHQARLYDPADILRPAISLGTFRNYDTALAFHPDGRRLFCGNEDGRVRVFDTATWTERPEEIWQAHSGAVAAIAISNDTRLLATSGDTTLKLWLMENPVSAARVEVLSFPTYFPAAWLHFGRDEHGADRSLLHCEPFSALEIWPGSR